MTKLIIEWKHLDVEGETCDRCYDTGENLVQEIKRLNRKLNSSGYEVILQETILNKDDVASSNIILFNGLPIEDIIEIKVSENYCESCSELINSEAYCRTITYDGNEYEDIPAKAIRHAAYKKLGLNQSEANSHSSSSCDCGQNGCC
jgi:hypothetical protein